MERGGGFRSGKDIAAEKQSPVAVSRTMKWNIFLSVRRGTCETIVRHECSDMDRGSESVWMFLCRLAWSAIIENPYLTRLSVMTVSNRRQLLERHVRALRT